MRTHFEQITRGGIDQTARVMGDFLRERLDELPINREQRYKPVIGPMPDRQENFICERAHEAERLSTNTLTPEEREDLIQTLTGRVLSNLSSWLCRPTSLEADCDTLAAIQRYFAHLPPAVTESATSEVMGRVEVRLLAQLEMLNRSGP